MFEDVLHVEQSIQTIKVIGIFFSVSVHRDLRINRAKVAEVKRRVYFTKENKWNFLEKETEAFFKQFESSNSSLGSFFRNSVVFNLNLNSCVGQASFSYWNVKQKLFFIIFLLIEFNQISRQPANGSKNSILIICIWIESYLPLGFKTVENK